MIEALIEIDEEAKQADPKKELVESLDLPDEFKHLEEDPDFNGNTDEEDHWHNMAVICMEAYFGDKQLHCGGPIPPKMLFSAKNIALVRDVVRRKTDGFAEMMDVIYGVLHECSPLRYDEVNLQKPWDIATVIKYMRDVHAYNIPKEFVPGITLLYLRFCKGYSVPTQTIDSLTQL